MKIKKIHAWDLALFIENLNPAELPQVKEYYKVYRFGTTLKTAVKDLIALKGKFIEEGLKSKKLIDAIKEDGKLKEEDKSAQIAALEASFEKYLTDSNKAYEDIANTVISLKDREGAVALLVPIFEGRGHTFWQNSQAFIEVATSLGSFVPDPIESPKKSKK